MSTQGPVDGLSGRSFLPSRTLDRHSIFISRLFRDFSKVTRQRFCLTSKWLVYMAFPFDLGMEWRVRTTPDTARMPALFFLPGTDLTWLCTSKSFGAMHSKLLQPIRYQSDQDIEMQQGHSEYPTGTGQLLPQCLLKSIRQRYSSLLQMELPMSLIHCTTIPSIHSRRISTFHRA